MTEEKKLVTIICPLYNEEKCVLLFYNRLSAVLETQSHKYDFELICMNNRSTDSTLDLLKKLREQDDRIQILTLSRNFGYQASVQAGLSHASGEAMIVVDADCEDPPELIPQFLEKWEAGYDVVYGLRKDRQDVWIIKKGRNMFYRLLRLTADMDIILYMAEFALISSNVRNAVINNQNTFPFIRSEIGYAGFNRYGIPYTREQRIGGKTHYHLYHLFSFGAAGILTASTFILRLAAYMLPFFVILNIVGIVSILWGDNKAVFPALVVVDFLYTVFLLTFLCIYQARIYKNAIGRPLYIVDPNLSYIKENSLFKKG
ncbi:glycosyl transferase family protein [Candidatus Omnitrophus magneticus]|uniref:Glycosyl transferase family protein n=1 Tax=Candidatus Omnitrophus magneticus TaxID=1609969 RepID=A0A0F0CL04_9BACT|nr:glycosyl transferase family protein [Candidatus Omnitrophus magneticus]